MDAEIAPASRAATATPNDSTVINARALYIGTTGDVAIVVKQGENAIIFKSVPAGTILPVHAYIVALTGTTAQDIVALY